MSNRAGNLARDVPKFTRIVPRGRWTDQAACVGTDPALWFHEREDGHYREARAICGACSVRPQCLSWAIETKTEHGLFGGLTPRERKSSRHSYGQVDGDALTGASE